MKLVTFESETGPRPGALRGQEIVDIGPWYASLLDLIEAGDEALHELREQVATARAVGDLVTTPLHAPLPDPPRQVIATGWNYFEHFEEGRGKRGDDGQETAPDYPCFFTKSPGSVTGPHDPIPHDARLSDRLDYEAEIALVIGRSGRSIPSYQAGAHIFGLMLANDVTVRDVQRQHGGQWFRGKSIDRTCPMGPWITTPDEVEDLGALEVSCSVGDQLRQQGTTEAMAFSFGQLLEHLSLGMTLRPGDILLTGTPPGVGYASDPPFFLQPGDRLVTESPQLGRLSNVVTAADLVSYTDVGLAALAGSSDDGSSA